MERWHIRDEDVVILRSLGEARRQAASDPVMSERRRLWKAHAACRGERPMVLAEIGGVLNEVLPDSTLQCQEKWAQGIERQLRNVLYEYERLQDDHVVEPWLNINWFFFESDYGVQVAKHRGDNQERLGSYTWEPPIQDLDKDFSKLHPRYFSVDREGTQEFKQVLDKVFAGVLPVRIRGSFYWTLGMTWKAIDLVGLDRLMLAMYDNPTGVHRLMAFLRDDHQAMLNWLEEEQLYSLNNEDDYVGSGTVGYTDELPQPGWQPDEPVRARDLWALSESQETVGVSPKMFEEFIFPYQLPVISRFGLSYYGCCEPVDKRWHLLKLIPNLRRLSVSPWSDQQKMAQNLGRNYIYCRKSHPGLVSTSDWDEERIKDDLRTTLKAAQGCNLEIVMKDVHTVASQPWRLQRWVTLARQCIDEIWV